MPTPLSTANRRILHDDAYIERDNESMSIDQEYTRLSECDLYFIIPQTHSDN